MGARRTRGKRQVRTHDAWRQRTPSSLWWKKKSGLCLESRFRIDDKAVFSTMSYAGVDSRKTWYTFLHTLLFLIGDDNGERSGWLEWLIFHYGNAMKWHHGFTHGHGLRMFDSSFGFQPHFSVSCLFLHPRLYVCEKFWWQGCSRMMTIWLGTFGTYLSLSKNLCSA